MLELTQKEILYPIVYPTVDIAVIDRNNKDVLMGRKKGRDTFCFIGGFVDPKDETLEAAAIRELNEEIEGLKLISNAVFYVCSSKINDSRYPLKDETIHTVLFAVHYKSGIPIPRMFENVVEFEELKWISIERESLDEVYINHKVLFERLIEWF